MRSIYFDHYTLYILINYNYKIVMSNVFPSNYVKLDVLAENQDRTPIHTMQSCVLVVLAATCLGIIMLILTSTRAMQECFVKILINHHLSLQPLIISKKH